MAIYALLVGVNAYLNDSIRDLQGCKNDVKLMQQTLQERFALDDNKIKTLTNREATKANIVEAFQTHLQQTGTGDTALFYFSGHGSQEPAGEAFWEIDPDRQLETLVCHDSRAGHVTDLANKELRYLISQISNNGAEVVIIIDSCHSGHASRSVEEADSASRQTSGQSSPRALKDFIFFDDATQQGWINDLANIPQGKHILLSACRDIELSKEKKIGQQRQGIFTHALCTLLNRLPNSLSYHNVLMRVRAATHKLNTQQTPRIEAVLEAKTEQVFLGKDIQPIQMISSFKNGQWELDAGLIHGIKVGDKVALKDDTDTTISIATINKAFAGRCILTNSHHANPSLKTLDELDKQQDGYHSNISHRHINKLRFSTEGDSAGIALLRNSIKTLSNNNLPSDFIIEIQDSAERKEVDYKIKAEDGKYTLSDAATKDFRPLFEPVPENGHYDSAAADEVLQQLEHLKRWQQKLELENICDAINMDAVQLVVKHNNVELIDNDVHLRYDYKKDKPKPRISLEIRCDPSKAKANIPLYCALLLFDAADASVTSLLDNDSKLLPPNTNSIFFRQGKTITVQVKDALFNHGINETEDFLKLIVSDKPFDAQLLAQKGLEIFKGGNKNINGHSHNRGINDALHNLLDQELRFAHTRSFDLEEEAIIPQWFTKTVKIITTRPLLAVAINANTAMSLSSGVHIEAHPNLAASISLSTLEDATRSLDSSAQNTNIIPPIFRDDAVTPPFAFSTTRNVTTDLNILELRIDSTKDASSGGIDSVTAENPLVISVDQSLNEDETVLAYSYDGEDYLPLGCSRPSKNNQTKIVIERLPAANNSPANNDNDESDKSLFGSIKIMFQKILHKQFGIFQDPTRIAIPLFENKENAREVTSYMSDRMTLKKDVKKAKRILLIIHGIIGSTHSIAGFSQLALSNGKSFEEQYDCILTFDYENLNQPIQETAVILKNKLADIGLDENHGKQLDIVSHSMGGLVSRCFIEFNHGDKVISKLIMLGTPNGGSDIAKSIGTGINILGDWANNTLAAIINGYITNGMGALAISGLVKLLNTSRKTLAQLEPNSDLLQLLEKSHQTTVPYYIIAGNTDFLIADAKVDTTAKFMQRMTQKLKLLSYQQLTHWLYQSPNDIAATVKSIRQLPKDWQQNTKVEVVACNHTSYFINDEVLQVIEDALL